MESHSAAATQPSPRDSYRELQPDDGPSAGAGPSTSAGGASTSAAGAGGSEPPAIRVWVRDPERSEAPSKLGIRTTYFTYLVRTESVLQGMRTDGTEVRRRFSEFDVSGRPGGAVWVKGGVGTSGAGFRHGVAVCCRRAVGGG